MRATSVVMFVGASLLAMLAKAPPIPNECALSLASFASKLAPTRVGSIQAAGFWDAQLLLPGCDLFVQAVFATE